MSLEVRNLSKSYGDVRAVEHLSFEMAAPGAFGLIGTNGAGKTTTIRMMLGLLAADEGEAAWNGRRISRDTLAFGYMPEERGIYMKTPVAEQLVYFAMLRGMKKADARAAAAKWMDRLGVAEYAAKNADKLSKGNQQKVQLIAAVINDPALVVLDEPFSGLDPLNTDVLREIIGEMVANRKYVILSSHQMAQVEDYCESLVLLHKGHAVLNGRLRDIKASYGHTNLIVSCREDERPAAAACGLTPLDSRANEREYKIIGDEMAHTFLKALVDGGNCPDKFEIREPSLHEIFIEKAGEDK